MDLDRLKKECEVTAFRASGPGGQHRNVTDSAIRVRHIPTGITVIGQSFRSQHRNLEDALERLAERIRARARRNKPRVPTKKSRGVRAREVDSKKRRGTVKRARGKVAGEGE